MDARERIRALLVTGDNRLKQGHDARALVRARESYEQALQLAAEHGLEEQVRPLVDARLADLDRPAAQLTRKWQRRGAADPHRARLDG